MYDRAGTDPMILFNKIDLLDHKGFEELERWEEIYSEAGYETIRVSSKTGEGLNELSERIRGKVVFLAGASGTGKSSILRSLTGEELRTGEVSRKLRRGRHTTTGVKLIPFGEDTFIADTPGFSKVDPLEFMDWRDVRLYFRELERYECRYPDCTHREEPGCAVREAVSEGEVSCERYRSYLRMVRTPVERLKGVCP